MKVGDAERRGAGEKAGVEAGDVDLGRLVELNREVAASGSCRCAIVVVPPGIPADLYAVSAALPRT